ncbi:CDP-alcohol phosphatidyltransferase family protein [Desulfuribacillus alkaliarsenatis]|uniref:CDP-alcohol phosphatidyltransferase n=1 Tax=Desulfuribacillus alkaliarsenatis TaxID=766136 RepID=A0A1E5G3D3_9FIRM|nr:CDP-alcohol phosphatidyltransferase family protein [Desulfuribacillus alkaliarsenatis]OEF97480.1 CDP-alcohol phosphatidyltransferase [Desulfuribacillus alkaliarsenatis]
MLDTHARPYVQPVIEKAAQAFVRIGMTANQVTVLSFVTGVSAGLFALFGQFYVALIVLWISGFLDAVDGTMARMTKTSGWGTVLDVTFDRIVEISIILALAYQFPEAIWTLLLLSVAIIFSMTVFLTVGAVSEKKGGKSFYYQAGLAERTEGFLLFSIMLLLPGYLLATALLFAAAVTFTGCQRLWEAKKILG